jgi:acetyl esterase
VPLDPQIAQLLDQMKAMGMPGLSELPVDQARAALTAFRETAGPPEDVAAVEDITIPGPAGDIPARVYRPSVGGPLPVVVFFHGGGWVLGDIESHDPTCRSLANRAEAVVVSVDYRLAPEAPYPAAVDDCLAATRWVAANGERLGVDAGALAVAGDSAGGNLAAVVSQVARDEGGPPIRFQLLIYPATDARMDTASCRDNAEGYFLTAADMRWFYGHYAGPGDDPRVSPLLAPDLAGLPPAMVITAEFDPLRDEGDAYAERLAAAGVPVEHVRCPGMIHGFFGMAAAVDAARGVVDRAGGALRAALAAPA